MPCSRFVERPGLPRTQPSSWFFAARRAWPRPKRSPGVVALVAGATLEATIDTRVLEDDADADTDADVADARARARARARAYVDAHATTEANAMWWCRWHWNTSHQRGHGRRVAALYQWVRVSDATIDAHRAAGGGDALQPASAARTSDGDAGRVSVYTTHASVVGAVGACVLRCRCSMSPRPAAKFGAVAHSDEGVGGSYAEYPARSVQALPPPWCARKVAA